MITTKAEKTSMSQTENVSTLPPGYVTLYQWTHCWNAGWTLGSVTQNNHSAGSLPSNRVTAQRKLGYCLSVMALCLLENDNTSPQAYGISFKPKAAKGKKADEMAPATPLWQRTCVYKMKKMCAPTPLLCQKACQSIMALYFPDGWHKPVWCAPHMHNIWVWTFTQQYSHINQIKVIFLGRHCHVNRSLSSPCPNSTPIKVHVLIKTVFQINWKFSYLHVNQF